MNFDQREKAEQEWMDDFSLGGEELTQTLDQLAVINRWLGGFGVIRSGMKILLNRWKPEGASHTLEIIDLGCGGGDNLIKLANWLRRKNIPCKLTGVDANVHVLAYAKEAAKDYPEIRFLHKDCMHESFHRLQCDILLCSLFLHHLDADVLKQYLPKWREQARLGVLVNDLHRSKWAWILFRGITFVFCASAMVRHDGSLSIRRSFLKKELLDLVNFCGAKKFRINWRWAFRWRLIIYS